MNNAAKAKPRSGAAWIWLSASALTVVVLMLAALGVLILSNSVAALWPSALEQVTLKDGGRLLGVLVESDLSPEGKTRLQYRVANRDLNGGADFRWMEEDDVTQRENPAGALLLKRQENGDFHGYFVDLVQDAERLGKTGKNDLSDAMADFARRWRAEGEPLRSRLANLGDLWQKTYLEGLRIEYDLKNAADPAIREDLEKKARASKEREDAIKRESEDVLARFNSVKEEFAKERAVFSMADGKEITLPMLSVLDAVWPNQLGIFGKTVRLFENLWSLISQNPREANTDGGIFPALFGTALLVFLMAILAFPLGVAAGIYLREYARDNILSRTARIAVNNLAGVPSIVYGIFGLGFFVYGLGGGIDALLYPERVAAGISTFGTGGLIWSSLTLGLLTLPVVIVATEESLATVPSEIRQGSLALGATRFQTLWRVLLPMASPGILTGFILAMARAAGEVAPLMITGVVKSAPQLPLDSVWPFLHPERKFMHLGFHIYDMGFQSPNVEAAKPLVYLTAMVLLALVFLLNVAAFYLRQRMREKYAMRGF